MRIERYSGFEGGCSRVGRKQESVGEELRFLGFL
jgi:hypothetical protein